MKRKQFSFASLLSLLLFVVTGVMWVRSQIVADLFRIGLEPRKEICLLSDRGALQVRFAVFTYFWGDRWWTHQTLSDSYVLIPFFVEEYPMEFDETPNQHWAFKAKYKEGQFDGLHASLAPDFRYYLFVVPYWIILVLSAIIPLRALLRRRRSVEGGCQNCSYDLTGNTSGVCPECGTAVAGKAEA